MENAWKKYAGNLDSVMNFGKDYIDFMSLSKTERETVDNSIKIAEKAGFKDLNTVSELKAGDKVYFNNRGKSLFLFVVGKEDLAKGLNILGAHVDSPRLDLKQHPLYEDSGLVLLDTHYYGGIKKYQWVAQPLALHGVVCKKDGSLVKVVIGESEDDPVVGVSDLLIHLAADQMKKTGSNVVEGEDLNVLFGSIPAATEEDEKELVKKNILNLLKEKYDIEEDDFISAEIEVVPAGKARDYGFDRSMVMAYGQDDNVCAYTSLRAIVEEENPERTSCCILSDKEEVGSQGNTGMHSSAFENTLAELMDKCGQYSELNIRRCLRNSMMLSSDVSAAHDPNYPSVSSPNQNNAEFGKENGVNYQTSELGKVDQGGGGTIAYILANKDVEVIDAGVAVQNMHACYEVTSKVDIYEAYLAYKAFLKDMK